MSLFNRVAILGVGLIGGSLGLELRKKGLAKEVVGVSRSSTNLLVAKKRGLVDLTTTDVKTAVLGADLVILASPVSVVMKHLHLLSELSLKTLVMDVGSTKSEIVELAQKILPQGLDFVGAHPLAGTEKGGPKAALENLFEGKVCILTPTSRTSKKALSQVKALWKKIGSRVVTLTPKRHDQILSLTSHLPQVVSSVLFSTVASQLNKKDLKDFSGSGFKDTTRLAASPGEMWADILISNKIPILTAIELNRAKLAQLSSLIQAGKREALVSFFDKISSLKK